jgi:serine/threonine-protein kinase
VEPGGKKGDVAGVPAESVRAELDSILRSETFAHAERLSRFLRFAVEQAIQGQADQFKEYLLGVQVFDRGESFDPRLDPVVRVEAHRLRSKLKQYYEAEGREDPVGIEFPKGGYVPVFKSRATPARSRAALRRPGRWKMAALLVGALVAGAAVYWVARPGPRSSVRLSSIAVLPFTDLSQERDQEYFCDGITDELINALAKVEGLHVVSRTSAFQFKGKASDVRKIGEQLNVGSVLEGSVRKAGHRLRITAQLVKAVDGYQLWSGTYERELKDVFAIQEEISRAIVNALRVPLAGEQGRRLVEGPTANLEAYSLYLRGRFYWNKRTEGGLKRSIQHFEQAIAAEPDYAVAWAGLADAYALLASYGESPPREVMPKARTAAVKALEIDNTLAQAYVSLGFVRSFYDWNWEGAEREYQRAIELNPGYATAHHWYSGCLRAVGRVQESLAEIQRALELDPLSLAMGRDMGRTLRSMRQPDRAIEQFRKVLELDPSFPSGYVHLGMAYEDRGMYREALAALQKARTLPGSNPLTAGALGHCYAASGQPEEARKLLGELEELSRKRYVSAISRALIYAGLGEKDGAMEWLEKAYQDHEPWLGWLNADPVFDGLRGEPRFTNLLKKVRLQK